MAKNTFFECEHCGYKSRKWLGKCPDCGSWNCFVEVKEESKKKGKTQSLSTGVILPKPITEINSAEYSRINTGIEEFNRVLGGGFVPGSLTLLGGEPGIGKSTLMLQISNNIAKNGQILYFSGEESPSQIRLRAERIGAINENILLSGEVVLENIIEQISKANPLFVVIDSIQTMFSSELSSAPGTVSQIREVTTRLLFEAKNSGIPVLIIGHITKEGAIAGPKTLEHIVDTVLYFEGDRFQSRRLIRAIKNRFGSTNELGLFEMTSKGLIPVTNPSEFFIGERPEDTTGSAIVCAVEGTRALLVELQALVTESAFGTPRRMAIGIDINRLHLLLAIIEKRLDYLIGRDDVYINVAGGLSINEPSVDLGIAFAVVSSFLNKPLDRHTVFIGEIGLSGEIRSVSAINQRLNEAANLGFKRAIIPDTREKIDSKVKNKLELTKAKTLKQAFDLVF